MPASLQQIARFVCLALALGALTACAGFSAGEKKTGSAPNTAAAETPKPASIASYLDLLDRMAPGDSLRQSSELASTLASAQQNPTAANRLRYAIALGAAGHSLSNPVEARRLITELLAGQNDLSPQEVSLANALLREYDARVALYADLARQREESEHKLKSLDAEGDRRYAALNAETQRLKKALAEAERKLEAVAEMERALTPEGQP
jgi:plasmid stability protein